MDLKEALEEKERIKKAGTLHWLHWVVISGSLIITFLAWHFANAQVQTKKSSNLTVKQNKS